MVAVLTFTSIPKMEIGQNMPASDGLGFYTPTKKKLDRAEKHIHRDNDNAASLQQALELQRAEHAKYFQNKNTSIRDRKQSER